jgi:hypothetical protein
MACAAALMVLLPMAQEVAGDTAPPPAPTSSHALPLYFSSFPAA